MVGWEKGENKMKTRRKRMVDGWMDGRKEGEMKMKLKKKS